MYSYCLMLNYASSDGLGSVKGAIANHSPYSGSCQPPYGERKISLC